MIIKIEKTYQFIIYYNVYNIRTTCDDGVPKNQFFVFIDFIMMIVPTQLIEFCTWEIHVP